MVNGRALAEKGIRRKSIRRESCGLMTWTARRASRRFKNADSPEFPNLQLGLFFHCCWREEGDDARGSESGRAAGSV